MVRVGNLRASDQDREQVAERLRQAAAEGRLLAEELEQRLARALRARTYAELDPLVADLPRGRSGAVQRRPGASPVTLVLAGVAVAVLALAVIAVVVALLTGFFAVWGVWAFMVWFFFSRGRRAGLNRCRHTHIRYVHRRTLL